MKKLFLCAGVFALMSTLTLKAQVTIGKNQEPNQNAVLDLQSNDKLGLLLPRVALKDTLLATPLAAHVKGMVVYDTIPSGDGKIIEGIYINDGRRWWLTNGGGGENPWLVSESLARATSNTQNIYQTGQVTVGSDTLVSTAMLNIVSNSKGILIPKLTTAQRDAIVTPPDGLLIYNVDEDCFDYYNVQLSSWVSLCGGSPTAKFTTACDSIVVSGTYVKDTPLTSANYLTVPIHVTRPGALNIVGSTTNGYSFSFSSTVTSTGLFYLNVPALGTPKAMQTDNIVITGGLDTCNVSVAVQSNIATYSIDCASVSVNLNGSNFVKGTALNSQTITLRVTVSAPGYYDISTPVTNGISFDDNGTFLTAGSQTITMHPVPISNPTVNADFPIEINANSPSGNTTCSAMIPVTLPPLTYATLGAAGTYTWVGGARATALAKNGSFSPTGAVRIVSLGQLWTTTDATTATNNLNNGVSGTVNGITYTKAQPDVIMFSSYGFTTPIPTNLMLALQNYVNKGGCLIFASNDFNGSDAQILLNGIFGNGAATATATTVAAGYQNPNQNDYQINPLLGISNDPIVNGPFGNIGGLYWQEDNTGTIFVTQLPPNSVQICSANNPGVNCNVPSTTSTVWYNNVKNFVYFGDSTGSWDDSQQSTTLYPSIFAADGTPKTKLGGYWGSNCTAGAAGTGTVIANSVLEFNSLAWCLHKAAVSGINPH